MSAFSTVRRLAGFPDPGAREYILSFDDWLKQLRRPSSDGFLVHGGPGSGKLRLLNAAVDRLGNQGDMLAAGPIEMGPIRRQTDPDAAFRVLAAGFLDQVNRQAPELDLPARPGLDSPLSLVMDSIDRALDALSAAGTRRTILLLHNFDEIHSWAANGLANHLRQVYDNQQERFGFILTTKRDLKEFHEEEHVFSPLRGVTELRSLLDLKSEETRRYARQAAEQRYNLQLTDDDFNDLHFHIQGYLSLIDAVLALLASQRRTNGDYSVSDAVEEICRRFYQHEPLRTVAQEIEQLTNVEEGAAPADVLYDWAFSDKAPSTNDRGALMLYAMGMLNWHRPESLRWRNSVIQSFWEGQKGRNLLETWRTMPAAFSNANLSAQGTVLVYLLLDLGEMFENQDDFDALRGTRDWYDALWRLQKEWPAAGDGPFQLWADQHYYLNLGHDLNLFRTQLIEGAFAPIYEAEAGKIDLHFDARLRKLMPEAREERVAEVEEMLHREWGRWDRVQMTLTRDGVLQVSLIREMHESRSLLRILDDLLGLEREFPEEERLEVSVQWELALAVVDQFIRQIGDFFKQLGLQWRGPQVKEGAPLYPNRDRYVIYQFRKLCTCRPWELHPRHRRLITAEELQPLMDLQPDRTDPDWSEAYKIGRELTALLEGVMVANKRGAETGRFPPIKPQEVARLVHDDLSSWSSELFATTLDNALILYNTAERANDPVQTQNGSERASVAYSPGEFRCIGCHVTLCQRFDYLYFPHGTVPYEHYWQCIILGLGHLLELRWAAQWVTSRVSKDLASLARLLDKPLEERNREAIDSLRRRTAINTRLLSHLREATVPLSIATADYAVGKYETFIERCQLRQIVANGDKDIEAINLFLQHNESQHEAARARRREREETKREQKRADDISRVLTWGGAALAILSLVVTIPSLWIDLQESAIGEWILNSPFGLELGTVRFMLLLTAALFLLIGLITRHWQSRVKRISATAPGSDERQD